MMFPPLYDYAGIISSIINVNLDAEGCNENSFFFQFRSEINYFINSAFIRYPVSFLSRIIQHPVFSKTRAGNISNKNTSYIFVLTEKSELVYEP